MEVRLSIRNGQWRMLPARVLTFYEVISLERSLASFPLTVAARAMIDRTCLHHEIAAMPILKRTDVLGRMIFDGDKVGRVQGVDVFVWPDPSREAV